VPPPSAAAPPPPAAGGSLDQAYAAVLARGPLWHKMTFNSQTGGYTFHMSVPSKLNTAASQNVEACATTKSEEIRRTLEQVGIEPHAAEPDRSAACGRLVRNPDSR
jgi:hypothetical protein